MSDRQILETVQGLGALAKEVEMLREQVKDLKQDRDSWRRLCERYECARQQSETPGEPK